MSKEWLWEILKIAKDCGAVEKAKHGITPDCECLPLCSCSTSHDVVTGITFTPEALWGFVNTISNHKFQQENYK